MNTSPGNAVFLHSYSDAASGLLFLALLGGLAARVGGVTFWDALAMALTAGVGALFGVAA